eukprot:3693261-Rhodomonas_salina.1
MPPLTQTLHPGMTRATRRWDTAPVHSHKVSVDLLQLLHCLAVLRAPSGRLLRAELHHPRGTAPWLHKHAADHQPRPVGLGRREHVLAAVLQFEVLQVLHAREDDRRAQQPPPHLEPQPLLQPVLHREPLELHLVHRVACPAGQGLLWRVGEVHEAEVVEGEVGGLEHGH